MVMYRLNECSAAGKTWELYRGRLNRHLSYTVGRRPAGPYCEVTR